MPNIKSAMKRVKVIKAKTLINQRNKSALKTTLKKFEASVLNGEQETATVAFKNAVKKIDQAVSTGILHKNTAARKKSQLARKFNAINA